MLSHGARDKTRQVNHLHVTLLIIPCSFPQQRLSTMTKKWAKPFTAILKSKSDEWKNAKDRISRQEIIENVQEAITDQIKSADGEDEVPQNLQRVRT
jgi:hypothetical protein